ncbi:MAG: alpha/beta hydrolase, partial [Oscillospiraceae bacterium]|nr:alpha/beta hydrolase [Oscillospiraceae bacterium]
MKIEASGRKMELIILRPKEASGPLPGLLWIHGGGYATGLASMVYVSRAVDLLETSGCVVVSPDYRRSGQAPYPAALEDCYAALVYMSEHGASLGI